MLNMNHPVISPKKLIEVALPLDAINAAAKEEKAVPRRGHPQTLHYWWARRPLAAARAVIFGQMVNDPSWKWELQHPGEIPPGHLKASWAASRNRLFAILEDLVRWENTTNETVLEKAREEIRKSWRETCEMNRSHPAADMLFNPDLLPALHDPFAGGGTIPLEAQRLGLKTFASDLNPVAVLINKALVEIPPKFSGLPSVSRIAKLRDGNNKRGVSELPLTHTYQGSMGLAEDIRYYGHWIHEEATKRIGRFYPKIEVTTEMAHNREDLKPLVGKSLTIIAWLWARTVKSPNPAFSHVDVPLASTFILSNKAGKDTFVQPIVSNDTYYFTVKVGKPPNEAVGGTTAGKRKAFRCLMSDSPMDYDYIRTEGKAGRMGQKLLAVVAEGENSRVYLAPTEELEKVAHKAAPSWRPDMTLPDNPRDFKTPNYGMTTFADLFTPRQLVALTTFSDLVMETRDKVCKDALASGMVDDGCHLDDGGTGATAYGEAVAVYLACALSRLASYNNTICFWNMKGGSVAQIFARQAIPMSWDFIEINPLEKMSGNWEGGVEWVSDVLDELSPKRPAVVQQADASHQSISSNKVVSTDPPYYDNIGYADLSDFFYLWLRRTLRSTFPSLLATMSVPKAEELIATPYRHGNKETAERFFLEGMTSAMRSIAEQAHPALPITIYYAFKQSETESDEGTSSTGWETFLEAVNRAGLAVTGTWPMRTERNSGVKVGTNVLASSIVLVCRPRVNAAPTTSRRGFLRELNQVLPEALDEMTRGRAENQSPVAPVDLSQAIIGPGMAVFSKYSAVLEADGTPMTVRTALQLINRFLAEDDFDADTQFCLHWFEQYGWNAGNFGEADTLARAKGTSVDGVKQAGVLHAAGGSVRLIKWLDYPSDWDPKSDQRLPVWEVLHQLIRVLKTDGEAGAGSMLVEIQAKAETARQLAYRLYTLCERAGRAEDARAYNELITSWTGIESAAAKVQTAIQGSLFDN
jgi:putative DNA methylase